MGVALDVRPADIDETPLPGEPPREYVERIALAKVTAIASALPGAWVLAADTTVTIDGEILAKAESDAEAAAMLEQLAGRTHEVITAFAIAGPGGARARESVTTEVEFTALSEREIAAYVASGEWRGKAGAYAIQGIAAGFVRAVRGSVTNVIGLPLAEVIAALRALGAPGADIARGQAV